MSRNRWIYFLGLVVALFATACTEIGITTPEGEKGEAGFSAYEVWKNKLEAGYIPNWNKEENSIADYFKFRKGQDGKDGVDGANGADGLSAYVQWRILVETGKLDDPFQPGKKWEKTKNSMSDFFVFLTGGTKEIGAIPYVGENGHWFVGLDDTGVPAKGEKGNTGRLAEPPRVTIVDGYWAINGVKTSTKAIGFEGSGGSGAGIPGITTNAEGFWVINGKPTDVKAFGTDGTYPEVTISTNRTWVIGGQDTGIPAFGPKGDRGKDGKDGKSAYELWKEYIADGNAPDPHNPGEKWNKDKNTEMDFWNYLHGSGDTPVDNPEKYSVIPEFFYPDQREYVNPKDGSVSFLLLDEVGQPAAAGVKIKSMPGANIQETEQPVTDATGHFKLTREQLPDRLDNNARTGEAVLLVAGAEKESYPMTTPNRINFRATVDKVLLFPRFSTSGVTDGMEVVYLKFERQVDNEWEVLPIYVENPLATGQLVIDKDQEVGADNLRTPQGGYEIRFKTEQLFRNGIPCQNISYFVLDRPLKLSETEKKQNPNWLTVNEDWMPTVSNSKFPPMIYQEGGEKYVGISVGDGEGDMNDYGESMYLPDKIYLAEQAQDIKLEEMPATFYVEPKDNELWLWGEVDIKDMDGFYDITPVADLQSKDREIDTYHSYQSALTKDAGNIWKPAGGWKAYTELPDVCVFKLISSSTGTGTYWFSAYTKEIARLAGTKVRFRVQIVENAFVSFSMYRKRDDFATSGEYKMSGEYRMGKSLTLRKRSDGTYYLQGLRTMEAEVKPCPADYLDY